MGLGTAVSDRLVAADPGLTRLYMAARATASVATALAILLVLAHARHLPLSVPLVGAALSMTWSITVSDPDPRAQRVTTLLLWLPAALSTALGTLTSGNRALCDALFLAVLFAAAYTRQYGPRANAIGMIAVLGFFFTLFLRADAATLPWLLLALAVSAACTYLYRFMVFRDSPQTALRNAVDAFHARQRLIAQTIADAARTGGWTSRARRSVERDLYRLNEAAIAIDDLLQAFDDEDSRARVVDAELETGAVVERAIAHPNEPTRMPQLDIPLEGPRTQSWTPRGLYRVGTQIQTKRLQPALRQAIQLTAAAAAAIIAGELLSPQRWYWAVLTAFLVFNGSSSAGETLNKAWSRVAGTALGVAAGALVAALVRGNDALAIALMFVFLFAGVYIIRLSYAVFTFFLTALLSMLYVLLHLFSDQLLVLRLIETAVGAACGGIAATLLLPIRTRAVLGSVSYTALERLADTVERSVQRFCGDANADPLAATRAYDEAMQSVRAQLEPLIATIRFAGKDKLRTRLLLYGSLGRDARALASLAYGRPHGCSVEDIRREGELVAAHIRSLVRIMQSGTGRLDGALEKPQTDSDALAYLYRIDRAVHRLEAAIEI